MAQIIKLRRGTLAELNSVTLANGELGVVTGSADIGDSALKTAIVAGHSDGTNRLTVGRLITGNATPDLSSHTGGSAFNDMLYHETDAKTLLKLHTGGNANLDLTGNIADRTVSGTLGITGIVSASSDMWVGGNIHAVGDITFEGGSGGTIKLGDASGDNLVIGADISSSMIPNDDDAFDLGSSAQQWKDLYIDGTANIDSLSADTAIIGDLTDNRVVIAGTSGELEDDANFTFDGTTLTLGAVADINGNVDIDNITTTIDSSDAISLDAGAASNFTTTAGALTLEGAAGVNLKENGTSVITIDTNQDTLFASTGGSTSDPDVEFDGYVRFDGVTEVANSTQSTSTSTGGLIVDGGIGVVKNVNVGGDLTVTGDYTVNGTTTFISSSQLDIGDNIIQVNSVNPVRYGGLQVKDVNAGQTGSMVWDSTSDFWIAGQSGSEYRVPLQNTTSDLTDNKIVIAQGNGRIESSANITDDGSTVDFNDVDLTSLDKLEGVDANTYVDIGGSGLIVTKGTLQPSAHNGNDLGATGTRYKDLWLQGNADLEGDIDVNGTANLDNTDIDGTLDVQGISDFQSRVDAQSSLQVTGSAYISTGASVAASSGSLISFRNDSDTQVGFLASADTQAVTAGMVGYNASTGNLTVSSVIDGGTF